TGWHGPENGWFNHHAGHAIGVPAGASRHAIVASPNTDSVGSRLRSRHAHPFGSNDRRPGRGQGGSALPHAAGTVAGGIPDYRFGTPISDHPSAVGASEFARYRHHRRGA